MLSAGGDSQDCDSRDIDCSPRPIPDRAVSVGCWDTLGRCVKDTGRIPAKERTGGGGSLGEGLEGSLTDPVVPVGSTLLPVPVLDFTPDTAAEGRPPVLGDWKGLYCLQDPPSASPNTVLAISTITAGVNRTLSFI